MIFSAPTGETATGSPECFAKCSCDNIDLAHHAAMFARARSPSCRGIRLRVRVIHHRQRIVFFCDLNNRLEISNGPAPLRNSRR